MIHTGAIVGGSLATLRVPGVNCANSVFHFFREDHEKRDFVAGGSAAGVAAAFGAPVGESSSTSILVLQSTCITQMIIYYSTYLLLQIPFCTFLVNGYTHHEKP